MRAANVNELVQCQSRKQKQRTQHRPQERQWREAERERVKESIIVGEHYFIRSLPRSARSPEHSGGFSFFRFLLHFIVVEVREREEEIEFRTFPILGNG